MLYPNYTEELLGLKDISLKHVERCDNKLFIHIEMHKRIHKCPRCGEWTSKVHDYRKQPIKDISAFGEMTVIYLRKRRHVCPMCSKRFYETVPFLPRYYRITNRLAAYVIKSLKDVGSMKSVSNLVNLSPPTVARIFDHVGYSNTSLPRVISIDEFRGNADGEKFQCIVTDPEHRKVIDILPNRKTEDMAKYFLGYKDRKVVQHVVIDMSGPFRTLAKSLFPRAKIIADRYHVVRQVMWAFENVRKAEQVKFYDSRRKYFKRNRRVLLKKPENLTEEETDQIEAMLKISERLRQAYLLKNEFHKLMDCKNRDDARKQLGIWNMIATGYDLPEFQACIRTFVNWSEEILNSFEYRFSNGYTEGVNNKIKVIKRNAFGIRDFKRFRNRILHVMS
ncbi:MAG: ISL3 family transposase [Acetivibrionales bacterium]|jgi:transposase|nr:ISL3 family transposase [Thermoanaerobacterales bacterium]